MVQGYSTPVAKKNELSAEDKAKLAKKQDEQDMQKRMKFGEHVDAEAEDSEQSLGKLGDSERNLINQITTGQEDVDQPSKKDQKPASPVALPKVE